MYSETFAPSPVDTNNGAQNRGSLAATHWWDHCEMAPYGVERAKSLAPAAAAFYQGGAEAVIKAGGTNNGYRQTAWALAMTAVHGPVGTHASQTQHPLVIEAKAKALADLRSFLGV